MAAGQIPNLAVWNSPKTRLACGQATERLLPLGHSSPPRYSSFALENVLGSRHNVMQYSKTALDAAQRGRHRQGGACPLMACCPDQAPLAA